MKNFIIFCTLATLSILSLPLKAQTVPVQLFSQEVASLCDYCKTDTKGLGDGVSDPSFSLTRLMQYQGTTIYWDKWRGNELDKAVDVDYSFQYRLSDADSNWQSSISFSGAFDFYAGSRASGPVQGRRYNPGFQLSCAFNEPEFWNIVELRFSLEHESNGQAIPSGDEDRDLDTVTARAALDALAETHRLREQTSHASIPVAYYTEMATESVSRGYNFFSVGTAHKFSYNDSENCNDTPSCFYLTTKLRIAVTKPEDFVFYDSNYWESDLRDYQGTNISLHNRFSSDRWKKEPGERFGFEGTHHYSISYSTGEILRGKVGKYSTFDMSYMTHYTFFGLPLPLVISYHSGYLEELHSYHEKESYLRLGLHLTF